MNENNKEMKQHIEIIYPQNDSLQEFKKKVDKDKEIFKKYIEKIENEQKEENH